MTDSKTQALLALHEALKLLEENDAVEDFADFGRMGLLDVLRNTELVLAECRGLHKDDSPDGPEFRFRPASHHIMKALSHLGRAGTRDEDTGLDHIYHSISRLILAAEVMRGGPAIVRRPRDELLAESKRRLSEAEELDRSIRGIRVTL